MQTYAGTAGAVQFQRPGAALLYARIARTGRTAGQSRRARRPQAGSHAIALDLRQRLKARRRCRRARTLQVVEVPPGPPVLATLLAEIYGPDAATRRAVAGELKKVFAEVPFIVDIDDSIGEPRPRLRLSIDQDRLEFFGVEQRDVYDTIQALFGGIAVGYSHRGEDRNPIEIAVGLPKRDLAWNERAGFDAGARQYAARQQDGGRTWPGRAGRRSRGGLAGHLPPRRALRRHGDGGTRRRASRRRSTACSTCTSASTRMIGARCRSRSSACTASRPTKCKPTLLWDGEWEITYVTFRDMGAAFGVAILGIYILVVAQFRSFKLPLVILTPIPLTLIGIVIGHWLFGAPFTATSMIGFIALAGIIVRNSILLVDFIRHGGGQGKSLREVLLEAGAVRFKPILLTALAAMIGAATILLDPIFQGLAISLLFGLASSTLLTVLVIPAIYVALRDKSASACGTVRD